MKNNNVKVLIPYQQGSLFRRFRFYGCRSCSSLNPLSAGKSFQTLSFKDPAGANEVLIPYQQGSLFRHKRNNHRAAIMSLNPLSAGKSFQTATARTWLRLMSLNPLSAGKSFQTTWHTASIIDAIVLIPYQQGSLFRHFSWTTKI